MKKTLIALMTTAAFVSCTTSQKNPLLSEWDTPYGIPPFSEISVDDYIPAIQAGIDQQTKEIDAIVADTAAPTFANTIEPLERSGSILAKVQGVLFNIHETDRTDALDSIVNLALPMLTEHGDNISFNKGLYERVAKVYHADQTALTREQQMVLKKHFESFERSGIGLPDDKQERLRQINADLAVMQQKVSTNILAENNAFKARFGVGISEYPTAMTTTTDRARREAMWKAYTTRCHNGNDNDNRQLIHDIMALRIEKAKIMGYKSPAHYILEPKMAHDPETVDAFLSAIMKQAVVRAKAEIADMQQEMNADIKAGLLPAGSTIQPWDWWYYAEKVRKAKYALNEDSVKQYFKLDNVVKGIFTAAERLYGVKMERLEGVPTYNDSVVTARNPDMPPFEIGIFFSGLTRSLVNSDYNLRVFECKTAAWNMLAYMDQPLKPFDKTFLRDIPKAVFEKTRIAMPQRFARRAEHFYSEYRRVRQGVTAWETGNLKLFGKLCFDSCESSIHNYECGSPELIGIYEILRSLPGVYGVADARLGREVHGDMRLVLSEYAVNQRLVDWSISHGPIILQPPFLISMP